MTQNHRIIKVGTDLQNHLVQPSPNMEKSIMKEPNRIPCGLTEARSESDIHLAQTKHV